MSTTTTVRIEFRDPLGAVLASGSLEIEHPDTGELHGGPPGPRTMVLAARPMTGNEIEQQAALMTGTYVQQGRQAPFSMVLDA
jgi:hypothetical protein